ncbi:fatty acid desaturase [Massilia sp. 9096]|uniref:DesA family fatty acid desaturase n=1 Tax=Massilia sp. 9096 TaxID=1500894 RepID=UPI0005677862|nr:fatty acid desaturase [Massilia sp. 9096]
MSMDHVLQWLAGGLLHWGPWRIVAYTAITTHLTIVAVTVYLHRCQAHRALDLHPAVAHLFRFWLWISTGMATREWVAVHRKHHARCEQPGDPHSPQIFGIRKVLLEGAELYRLEARDAHTVARYGHGAPDDWLEGHVYAALPWQGVGLLLMLDVALFGAIGATVWAVQMLWIPVLAAGVVNGLGHFAGYRSFDGPNAAANILPWGLLIGGEELHNNHHTFPTSAKLSVRWFEFDVGWLYIRLLCACRLARVRTLPPRMHARGGAALPLDAGSVAAVTAGRHYLMRDYGRMLVHVFRDELRAELRRAGDRRSGTTARMRRQAERLLRREPDNLAAHQLADLRRLLERYQPLARLQAMRAELRAVWESTAAGEQEALALLAGWCERAERSGMAPLLTFARTLRAYR